MFIIFVSGFLMQMFVWDNVCLRGSVAFNKRRPMSRKMLNGAFSRYAFYTVTNPLYFSLPHLLSPYHPTLSFLSIILIPLYIPLLLLLSRSTLCALCPPFLSSVTSLSLPFPPSPLSLLPSLYLSLSSSSGSPGSQSLYVWLSQRHLLYAALPAFGSGQDTAADPAEQCQAGVCVCTHDTQIHLMCMNMQTHKYTHTTHFACMPSDACT